VIRNVIGHATCTTQQNTETYKHKNNARLRTLLSIIYCCYGYYRIVVVVVVVVVVVAVVCLFVYLFVVDVCVSVCFLLLWLFVCLFVCYC
jgi:hypothetical protein